MGIQLSVALKLASIFGLGYLIGSEEAERDVYLITIKNK